MSAIPTYLDWQFWTAIAAILALILSQLPPVRLWFKPRRLEVEVHSRIQITHKAGNPNIGMFTSIRNTGGRDLRVRSMEVSITRDGDAVGVFRAQNYFVDLSTQARSLFMPFTLKPGDSWDHGTNFFKEFDRATEKYFREHSSALASDIRTKISNQPDTGKSMVSADPDLVQPFKEMFDRLFVWIPGEYVVDLVVNTDPGTASFAQKYRYTLYESDSDELKSYTNDYKHGAGLVFDSDRHAGIFIPLQRHSS